MEAVSLEVLAGLLTSELAKALGIAGAELLLWNRRLDSFETLTPGETRLSTLRPGGSPASAPDAGFLLADGGLLPTRSGRRDGVLVPLQARSGLVGMLVLDARAGRRRLPFRPTEVRLLSVVATRAALAVENHLYQRELLASERMAALGTMAGMLAHDLRNPMTVIRGHAEMLLDGGTPDRIRLHADAIVAMVDRLDRMTRETLDFARAGGTVARRILPLRKTLDALADEIEKEVPGLPLVRIWDLDDGTTAALDPDKLRRALANMAANARDAMKPGGRLHLTARLGPGTPDRPARRLVLEVADEGPGIPPEIQDTVFEPFVTQGKKTGTGLGLAVARRFVEDHGGTVELVRDPPPAGGPSGARFRILLPVDPPPPGGLPPPSAG
jgi:signal transduction histidine kinase